MGYILQSGENRVLESFSGTITVTHDIDTSLDISLTAFLLTDSDIVQGDNGMIFYNQPIGPNGVATLLPARNSEKTSCHTINFNLNKCPVGITKIAITLTEDNNIGFVKVKNLKAEINAGSNIVSVATDLFTIENGIVILELYLRNDQAKVRSVWRGFESGLYGLCKKFGVEIQESTAESTVISDITINGKTEDTHKSFKPTDSPVKKTLPQNISDSSHVINLQKVSGKINLSKGQKAIVIEKTPEITACVSWDTGTDYDIYAIVYTKDNRQIDVATFGADGVSPLISFQNGAVQHMGDVGRDNLLGKTEVIKIRLNDNILAVVPVVYSAQSNGTGSFYRYKVSMVIDNHKGTEVTISSINANKNDAIYTCVPGMILNTPDGVVIDPVECYSRPESERRPKLIRAKNGNVEILMDAGPVNDYK